MKSYHAWLDIGAGKVITQPMQRVLCQNFASKLNGKIIFELGEDVEFSKAKIQFKKMYTPDLKVDGFIFLGLEQFVKQKKLEINLMKDVLKKGYELHYIRQNLSFFSITDFKKSLNDLILFSDLNKSN